MRYRDDDDKISRKKGRVSCSASQSDMVGIGVFRKKTTSHKIYETTRIIIEALRIYRPRMNIFMLKHFSKSDVKRLYGLKLKTGRRGRIEEIVDPGAWKPSCRGLERW